MPTEPQAAVYSGVLHYLKSVAAVGADETNAVMNKMRTTPVDDFFARGAMIREDGKLIHDFYLLQVKAPSEVKAPWEYYNVLQTVSSKDAYFPLSKANARW